MASEEDIALAESDIRLRIKRWRNLQAAHMPDVDEAVLSQAPSGSGIEEERIHLPSSFLAEERESMLLNDLAEEEIELRKAQVVECILQLRRSAKRLSAIRGLKKKDDRGQKEGGRATSQRHSIEFTQECLLAIYSIGRHALVALDAGRTSFEKQFPILTSDDLSRKATTHKRQMGDSHRAEGALWGVNPRGTYIPSSPSLLGHPSSSQSHSRSISSQPPKISEVTNSQSDTYLRASQSFHGNDESSAGKLWDPMLGLSSEEMEKWELEGSYPTLYQVSEYADMLGRRSCAMVSCLGQHAEMA